jgi:uncharacterized membrane protein
METHAADEERQHKESCFWFILTVVALIQTVVFFFVCSRLPEEVPVHFNYAMKPDRYGSPWELGIVSVLTPVLFCLRPLVNKKSPQNPRNIKIENGVVLFSGIFIAALSWWTAALGFMPAREQTLTAVKYLPFFVYVIFGMFSVVFGNYEGTIKPNKTLGIKLPWTLKDTENWRKTHRFAAPLTVAAGIALIAGGTAVLYTQQMVWYLVSITVFIILAVILPVVYSYGLSRKRRN